MRYDNETIEKVRYANDIVDIVGRHVRLTKKGANYFGLCPFHGEKTPSFSVSPRKQIFYCFGCGVGGSVIDFVMQYENYSFQEAVKALADNAHIDIPENAAYDQRDRQASELRGRLLEVNKEAALYYNSMLRSFEGRIGYEYFAGKRGLKNETITHFGLGYADKNPDSLYKFLKDKGYDDELLSKSGLVTFTEKGGRDKFWNRVMFPIMDTNNRVIGFGGRVMGEGEPKYLNSPETPIFDKSSNLYGLNFAKKSRMKYLLLCEGYMDVIALHQAGFTNAVASLGTAFTEKHARLLKRYTDNVILTQDSDKAGINAKLKAFPILYEAGLNVKVLDTGKYKDPDEFIRAEGAEGYERCIRNAKNAFLYVISVLKSGYDLSDPAEKTDFVRETADRLCMFRDAMERENYIDAVSREFMMDKDELKRITDRKMENGGSYTYRDINENRTSVRQQSAAGNDGGAGTASTASYEELIISWLAERPELCGIVFAYIKPEEFNDPTCRMLADAINRYSGSFEPVGFLDSAELTEDERRAAARIFAQPDRAGSILNMTQAEIEKGLTEAIRAIRSLHIDRETEKCGNDMTKFAGLLESRKALRDFKVNL